MRKNRAGFKQNGYRMLTLDDDATITAALKAYFEASGFQVDTENDPLRALERMKETKYHILLLDFLMMPICGDEVVARLRAFDTDIFIILLTGHKELAPPLNTLKELDIQGYYEKSERFDQLELLVESCLKSIKQMQVIRRYRDGLSCILAAASEMHQLDPVEKTLRTVLKHISTLTGTENTFVLIKPEELTGVLAEYAGADSPSMYAGSGYYDMGAAQFTGQILPNLEETRAAAVSAKDAVCTHNIILAPIYTEMDNVLGIIGASTTEPAEEQLRQIFGLFSKQASAAINNVMLHNLVSDKNTALDSAYNQLKGSYLETISALRLIVDAKDIYTRGHSDRVSELAADLARHIGRDDEYVDRLRVAGLFHDVGKVGIPEMILTKDGPLTDEEYDQMKKHPSIGARIMSTISMFSDIIPMIESHHERYDGRGYPAGLAGEDIPEGARIMAIADAYDAMTSNRHYRASLGEERALNQLSEGRGSQFDAALVDAFIDMLARKE